MTRDALGRPRCVECERTVRAALGAFGDAPESTTCRREVLADA